MVLKADREKDQGPGPLGSKRLHGLRLCIPPWPSPLHAKKMLSDLE